jgi:hypothetical protein
VRDTGLKIPQLAMPVRVLVMERRRRAFAGIWLMSQKRCRHAIERSEKIVELQGAIFRAII